MRRPKAENLDILYKVKGEKITIRLPDVEIPISDFDDVITSAASDRMRDMISDPLIEIRCVQGNRPLLHVALAEAEIEVESCTDLRALLRTISNNYTGGPEDELASMLIETLDKWTLKYPNFVSEKEREDDDKN